MKKITDIFLRFLKKAIKNPLLIPRKIYEKSLLYSRVGFQVFESVIPAKLIIHDKANNLNLKRFFGNNEIGLAGEEEENIIKSTNKIMSGTFEVLGTAIPAGGGIDWHLDYSSGYRFPERRFFLKIKPAPEKGVDIKLPWEVSRFYFAPQLAIAYRLTGNEKYLEKLLSLILDWIEKNPWKRGVNWACAMDVAIRACNWLLAIDIAGKDFERIATEEKLRKISESLYLHGKHIFENLEYSATLTSNHYISDLIGLLYLGIYLPENPSTKRWLDFAVRELEREIQKQVYKDGADFEASTCYHRLVLEIFFYSALIARKAGINFSDRYHEKLRKMFYFVLETIKPDGKAPQIGDNDSGRTHVLYPREVLDFTYLLTLGSVYFRDEDLKIKEFGLAPETKILFPREDIEHWQKLPSRSIYDVRSTAFKDSGIYVMRNKKDYMIISCGPNGQNDNGGHAHNDKLSFEIQVNDLDFIVDPGTGYYTSNSEIRNILRSTSSHSTIQINEEEQNRFYSWTIFAMQNDAKATCSRWETNDEKDSFEGMHYGYLRLPCRAIHKRRITFIKNHREWLIEDEIEGKGSALLEWFFQLHPEVKYAIDNDKIILIRSGTSVEILLEISDGSNIEVEDALYSPEYGVIIPSKKIKISLETELPFSKAFKIVVQ